MLKTFNIAPLFTSGFDPSQLMVFPFLGAVLLLAWVTMKRTPEYKKNETINSIGAAAVTFCSLLLFLLFGASMTMLKGVLLADIFLYASVSDIKTRKVTDAVPLMLFLLGLVDTSPRILLCRTVTALAFFGAFILLAVIFKNKIGGADVKFISDCMLINGFTRGFVGLVAGLLLAVVGTLIRNKKTKSKDDSLPLVPYLSVGFFAAYLMGGI